MVSGNINKIGDMLVREGAHMFWWLHYTIAETPNVTDRPLILWLQGGPGSSSTGYGNFEILGPYDLNMEKRDFTWIKTHNVLFVDNPVGTGFSYVEHIKYLTKDNKQIAEDLVELLRGFYEALPEFKSVPLHIFGESYGGKMAIEFAHELYHEIENGNIESNLVTVAMGDAWISPIDSTLSWAPYLFQLGFVDEDGYERINNYALRTKRALDEGKYFQATDLWAQTEEVLLGYNMGVDFYNVLYDTRFSSSEDNAKQLFHHSPHSIAYDVMVKRKRINIGDESDDEYTDPLTRMMRDEVHPALGLSDDVKFGSQSSAVFDTLGGDFMKPVVSIVEHLLNNTSVKVVVYSGQLDLICSTPGTVKWVNEMNWVGSKDYANAPRDGIGINNVLEGYVRKYGNFSMYWINKAGHMAPFDNPRCMGYILRQVTNFG
ncbi:CLUMA_CG016183, isoform A [Clunio marinus]|uniref:Carboxypeptidase n=1 Tax=Clunio marinus TaxID=568069 RepID=A0A1J1ISE0_9DIPT|nr:CLUMA_CG016183, isoform A [Clunio marinus]